MPYVADSEVTIEYVQSLCERCGFTDETENYSYAFSALDLDGITHFYPSLTAARTQLILAYVIQQNS
jgi:hypothetical protein